MPSLDKQWLAAKRDFDRLASLYGPRSLKAKAAHERMTNLAHRILRRDNRKRAA